MNRIYIIHAVRIIVLSLIQVLVLRNVPMSSSAGQYIFIIIYPVGLLLLPIALPQFFALMIAFLAGTFVDIFYQSPGVHAGACLWMVFMRPWILKYFEPKSGYSSSQNPTGESLGIFWFMRYVSVLMFVFFFSYFVLEVFTFVYMGEILLKAILSFSVSLFFIFVLQILINPKY